MCRFHLFTPFPSDLSTPAIRAANPLPSLCDTTRYLRAAEDPDDESSDKGAKHAYEDRRQEAAQVFSRHH